MNEGIEFYPMPTFPTLAVKNLSASSNWYQEIIGFRLIYNAGPFMIHLRWAKYADLLLIMEQKQIVDTKGLGVSLNFAVTQEPIDHLAEKIIKKGGTINNGPIDQPWNVREFSILDPDGYKIVFNQIINKKTTMEELSSKFA